MGDALAAIIRLAVNANFTDEEITTELSIAGKYMSQGAWYAYANYLPLRKVSK